MKILITNIKELVQVEKSSKSRVSGKEMNVLPTIKNAYLLIENALIKDFGKMRDLPDFNVDETINASGRTVLPAWCDSHTHIVYAGNREQEFIDRIKGLSYEEIAKELNLPLGTVKAQLFRARQMLFKLIESTEINEHL